jgi:hypothetical protein
MLQSTAHGQVEKRGEISCSVLRRHAESPHRRLRLTHRTFEPGEFSRYSYGRGAEFL